ncbi:nuclear transport factor 2 family protein [Phytoactinopolyspora limicola]|uniref:nuclear transport factor 2 family protein n=1 Tax=Phytoactinopolyspora limicola TaxID=2715536 RepID=UPI00140B8DC4|nr:nuclear transport factor 2 family protein [Phytoactinopolyspora limicola]
MTKLPTAVQRVLDGMTTGNWEGIERHLTPDVFHDASVPGWRMQFQGVDRVAQEMRSWTVGSTFSIEEQTATVAGDTVVVELQATQDSPHGWHVDRLANIFVLRDGRIAEHRYYCCGEWDEATVRKIEAEAPKVERDRVPANPRDGLQDVALRPAP